MDKQSFIDPNTIDRVNYYPMVESKSFKYVEAVKNPWYKKDIPAHIVCDEGFGQWEFDENYLDYSEEHVIQHGTVLNRPYVEIIFHDRQTVRRYFDTESEAIEYYFMVKSGLPKTWITI